MKTRANILQFHSGHEAHQDINNHSASINFTSARGIDPPTLRSLARDLVGTTAAGCEAAGALDVSHVKAFFEHDTGFLHANAVSGNNEITVGGRDGETTRRFRLVLNAVIYGLPQESIRKAAERAIEEMTAKYGLTREPEEKQG